MPYAFHLLILARVFHVPPRLSRLLIVCSTVPAVAAVLAGTALLSRQTRPANRAGNSISKSTPPA